MKAIIQSELRRIESTYGVQVLYAVESGSRAWGFASTDSDYDVRFLYVHPADWYLSVEVQRDVIQEPINDALDLSGWDLRKALGLLRKSNPPLLEWLNSPIVYHQDDAFITDFRALAASYYSPEKTFLHYLHMAEGNFREYLKDEIVWVKKYLYVLRPIFACRWIERGLGPVPMEFSRLAGRTADDPMLRFAVADLVMRKQAGEELDRAPRVPIISDFIDSELARLSSIAPEKGEPQPTTQLNAFFRNALLKAA
jgi:predicted nucleotidyltransferase